MKNLFTPLFLLAFICFATNLTAQTYKQKVRSAERLNQIMPSSLKITPDMIRKVTRKELRADIQSAGYEKEYEAALLDLMIPAKIIDWRGIIVELSEECNAKFYFYGISVSGKPESFPGFYFSSGNKCEKLYLQMLELGLVNPFQYPDAPDDNYSACISTTCVPIDSGSGCCVNVVYRVPEGKECPPAECTADSCDCTFTLSDDFWVDVYMEK
jgi:hypothetical protein